MFIQGKWTESRQTRIFQSESRRYTSNHTPPKITEEVGLDPDENPTNQKFIKKSSDQCRTFRESPH